MAEYISGEKHREMTASPSTKTTLPKPLLAGIVVIVLMGLSFYGGVAYQKGRHSQVSVPSTTAGGSNSGFGGRGRFGGGQRPTIGPVTAVSATSITVQDSHSGSDVTLSITSSTQITDNGQTAAASDITVGENVLITASTTDKTQAARILVNPSFGGGSGASGTSSTNSNNSSDPTVTN